jgi:short-subunit dehydrogenase
MKDRETAPFAVVTGASSGIGLELARLFARGGYDLMVAADDDGIAAAESLRAEGAKVDAVQVDLATREGTEELCRRIDASGRDVDALALNAGVGLGGAFLDNALEDDLRLIQLNIVSVVHVAKHVLTRMVARDEGRVLFTSSIAAESPQPFLAAYAASKAFVQSFAEGIRNELKDTNVVVTVLQPGATDTNFFARAGMEDTAVAQGDKMDPADVARAGFDALMKGKDHVISASRMERAQVLMGHVTPQTMQAEQARKVNEPGSGA